MEQVRELLGVSRYFADVKQFFMPETDTAPQNNSEIIWSDAEVVNQVGDNDQTLSWEQYSRGLRAHWHWRLVPREIALTDPQTTFSDNLGRELEEPLKTVSGKRVLPIVSSAFGTSEWQFNIPQRSYEVWAFLPIKASQSVSDNWYDSYDRKITAFILPQKIVSQLFVKAKGSLKKTEKISAILRQDGARFILHVHGSDPVDITAFQNSYDPLK